MSDILCITNRKLCKTDFICHIREIAENHPLGIVLREKDTAEADYRELASRVLSICSETDTLCILHGFHNAAAELGAKAVHLTLDALRKMSDKQKSAFTVIGVSCHSAEEAMEAEKLGCTYIIAGHIFPTDCKKGQPGRGLDFLAEVCAAVCVPVYGIGGIDAENVNFVRDAGASGVCTMSGIMQCSDVKSYLCRLAKPECIAHKPYAIFDMDGTLIDSMRFWRGLAKEYLESKGIKEDLSQTLEDIVPMTMSESAALFVSRFALKGTPASVTEEMSKIMDRHYREDIPLKAHVLPFLNALRAKGVRMCVASATAEPLMVFCLKRLGIYDLFDFVLSCETFDTSKREPMIYLEAAKRFHAGPEETVVYEDALYAVETAVSAGFHVNAVYDRESDMHWEKICGIADEAINLN